MQMAIDTSHIATGTSDTINDSIELIGITLKHSTNHNETISDDSIELNVEEMEEVIAPGSELNHNESLDNDAIELDVEEMEEVIAPRLPINHNETILNSEMMNLKARLKTTWMTGDFDKIAEIIWASGSKFIERLNLKAGARVLDVACGTGNLSLPAARAGAVVTGLDIALNSLVTARKHAEAEGVTIQFDEGDAESLPYADAAFDEIVTMFGAMFAPQPELVAAELARVCRPGGRVAMANWTANSFIGEMFKVTGRQVTPPPMSSPPPSPMLWGDQATVRQRLEANFSNIQFTLRQISFTHALAPAEVVEFWRVYYGPTNKAFESLQTDPKRQAALRSDLEQLWSEYNQATDGTTHVETEYLEVIATRN